MKPLPLMNEGLGELRVSKTFFYIICNEIKTGSHLQKVVFWCIIYIVDFAHKLQRKEAEQTN